MTDDSTPKRRNQSLPIAQASPGCPACDRLKETIEQQKQIEAALRSRLTFFKTVIDSIRDGIHVLQADLRLTWSNRTVREWFNNRREPTGEKCYALYRGRSSPCDNCQPLMTLTDGRARIAEKRVTYPDGTVRDLEIRTFPFYSDGSDLNGVVETMRDVTSTKRMEAILAEKERIHREMVTSLRESENRFRTLAENIPVLVIAVDSAETVIFWNRECERVTGYTAAEIVDNPEAFSMLIPDSSEYSRFVRRLRKQAEDFRNREVSLRDRGGKEKTISWFCIADRVPIPGWERWIIGVDVTEKKTLEAQSVRAWQLASVGELAAGLAHEINNPINGIINFAQIIIDLNETEEDGENARFAGLIVKEGERIGGILRRLLTLSRRDEEEKELVRLSDIVNDTLVLTESLLAKDGIHIDVQVPETLPLVEIRVAEMQQVLMNLISNSRYSLNRKYPAPHPEKRMMIAGAPQTAQDSPMMRITVWDSGIGVAQESLERICAPFFTTKPRGIGTGLGLGICCAVVADHGGEIRFSSREGEFFQAVIDIPTANEP